jgi:purine nucleoside permease
MKKTIIAILIMAAILLTSCSRAGHAAMQDQDTDPLPVKVLILPKLEVGEMTGDFPGEAQYYFEQYLIDADEYDIPNGNGNKLYYKDGVALYVLGMGKVNAALGTMTVLSDNRFDFSQAYIISTGCSGSAIETTVMGDVFIITSAVDFDLGHHADSREIADSEGTTWFHDASYDSAAVVRLDPDLTEKVFNLVKDVPVETTEVTRRFMGAAFENADWAVRDPEVLRGTTLSSDNYWKGLHDHANALLITETYRCPDPYVCSEMEDVAVARAAERMGFLDHLIIIRDSTNMDEFMLGSTPETLWGNAEELSLATEENMEAADIFATAMKNNFKVGRIVIDQILKNQF